MNNNFNKFLLAKESFIYIVCLLLIGICLYVIVPVLAVIPLFFLLFIFYFFRNPPRKITKRENMIISPADGKVMYITEIDDDRFIFGRAYKISIFLSVFNVHINRAPISGIVKYIDYRPGKFLPAFKSHASEINERNTVGIENENIKIMVNQLTGFLARRIVCFVKEGDLLNKGDRYGLIEFGSCTEIIIPVDKVYLQVKPGEKVRGGKSIIGVLHEDAC